MFPDNNSRLIKNDEVATSYELVGQEILMTSRGLRHFGSSHEPDVADPFFNGEHDLIARHRKSAERNADVSEAPRSRVKVPEAKGRSDRTFAVRVQSLPPDAVEAVPIGAKVHEISIG